MEVQNLAQGGDKGDPLHGERLALAQRDLAVTGMIVFMLVSRCTIARRFFTAQFSVATRTKTNKQLIKQRQHCQEQLDVSEFIPSTTIPI